MVVKFDGVTTNELFELLKIRVEKSHKRWQKLTNRFDMEFFNESFEEQVTEIMREIIERTNPSQ